MKIKFSKTKISILAYFAFYSLLTTNGVVIGFYALVLIANLLSFFMWSGQFNLLDFNYDFILIFPNVALAVFSYWIIKHIKNYRLFFGLNFIVTALSHYLLSLHTRVELGDPRLVIAAIIYLLMVSYTLTLLRKRVIIEKDYKTTYLLLGLILGIIYINFFPPEFLREILSNSYTSFAWWINSLDSLFSKLNMTFTYFLTLLSILFAGIVLLSYMYARSYFDKMKK